MDDVIQIYIDKLAQATYENVMLEVENRRLKEDVERFKEKGGDVDDEVGE